MGREDEVRRLNVHLRVLSITQRGEYEQPVSLPMYRNVEDQFLVVIDDSVWHKISSLKEHIIVCWKEMFANERKKLFNKNVQKIQLFNSDGSIIPNSLTVAQAFEDREHVVIELHLDLSDDIDPQLMFYNSKTYDSNSNGDPTLSPFNSKLKDAKNSLNISPEGLIYNSLSKTTDNLSSSKQQQGRLPRKKIFSFTQSSPVSNPLAPITSKIAKKYSLNASASASVLSDPNNATTNARTLDYFDYKDAIPQHVSTSVLSNRIPKRTPTYRRNKGIVSQLAPTPIGVEPAIKPISNKKTSKSMSKSLNDVIPVPTANLDPVPTPTVDVIAAPTDNSTPVITQTVDTTITSTLDLAPKTDDKSPNKKPTNSELPNKKSSNNESSNVKSPNEKRMDTSQQPHKKKKRIKTLADQDTGIATTPPKLQNPSQPDSRNSSLPPKNFSQYQPPPFVSLRQLADTVNDTLDPMYSQNNNIADTMIPDSNVSISSYSSSSSPESSQYINPIRFAKTHDKLQNYAPSSKKKSAFSNLLNDLHA